VAKAARFWLVWFLICLGLWMLLVFKTEPAEVVAGAIASALAATGVELVRASGYAPFAPDRRWWRGYLRLPGEVLRDTWLIVALLHRHFVHREPVKGRFRIVHFQDCAGDDPRSQARRATAIWLSSVSPNAYILGFDEQRDIAVLHQLVPSERTPDLEPPT
jgi:hypothetical protein